MNSPGMAWERIDVEDRLSPNTRRAEDFCSAYRVTCHDVEIQSMKLQML